MRNPGGPFPCRVQEPGCCCRTPTIPLLFALGLCYAVAFYSPPAGRSCHSSLFLLKFLLQLLLLSRGVTRIGCPWGFIKETPSPSLPASCICHHPRGERWPDPLHSASCSQGESSQLPCPAGSHQRTCQLQPQLHQRGNCLNSRKRLFIGFSVFVCCCYHCCLLPCYTYIYL